MKTKTFLAWTLISLFLLLLSLPLLWKIVIDILRPQETFWGKEGNYLWLALGIVIYYITRKKLRKTSHFMETFSHEITHAVVALCLGKKIHSLHVDESGTGMVCTSGNNVYTLVPIALSPYCLPLFTFILLLFRCFIKEDTFPICDVLIGVSICFHYYCFGTQIGNHQTDINQYPIVFSYFYIATFWIVNVCLILSVYSADCVVKIYNTELNPGLIGAFKTYGIACWENAQMLLNYII